MNLVRLVKFVICGSLKPNFHSKWISNSKGLNKHKREKWKDWNLNHFLAKKTLVNSYSNLIRFSSFVILLQKHGLKETELSKQLSCNQTLKIQIILKKIYTYQQLNIGWIKEPNLAKINWALINVIFVIWFTQISPRPNFRS